MKKKHNSMKVIIGTIIVILLCVVSFLLGDYYAMKIAGKDIGATGDNSAANPTVTQAVSDTENMADSSTNGNSSDPVEDTDNTTGTESPTPTVDVSEADTDTTSNSNTTDITPTASDESIRYSNSEYGFDFKLPTSWKGYTTYSEDWQGVALEGEHQGEVIEAGVKIFLRHPKWTLDNPRQDIPIMVFTLDQWDQVESEGISVSAAPIIPTKLGSNSKYVFALPARYNYAFPEGYEEVEDILAGNPLTANENFK